MATTSPAQRLESVSIDNAPRDTVLRLLKPLLVDEEVVCETGQCLLIPDPKRLSFELRITIEATRKRLPESGYFTFNLPDLTALVYVAPKLHDGPGEICASGNILLTSGPKQNIAPSPITAETVEPTTIKVCELPRKQTLVAAASYYLETFTDGVTSLFHVNQEDLPSPNLMGGLMVELYLNRGTPFVLAEQDGQLVLSKLLDRSSNMVIDPDSDMEVYVPGEREN